MKKVLVIFAVLGMFASCDQPDDKLEEAIELDLGLEEVAEEEKALPELSVYNLPATWTTQNNEQMEMEELRGNVVVMVMIYTSCKAACPRLVADMRNIEKQVEKKDLEKVKFVMVSIDPETDTPQRLKEFAKVNQMEDDHWLFLRGTPEDTREFATVLAVGYKKISPMDFSHSNIISVFDEQGVLVHQQEGLGVDNAETIEAIQQEVKN